MVAAAAVTKASGPGNSDGTRGAELVTAHSSVGDEQIESAYGTDSKLAAVTATGHM